MPSKKLALYQLLISLLAVLLLEGAARLAFTFTSPPLYASNVDANDCFRYRADLGWERRPSFNGRDPCGVQRAFGAQGLLSIDALELNVGSQKRRVLFLGDSNTYGYCLPTGATFVGVAARLLPNFSMINIGVPGYTSFQGYK